MNLPLCSIPNFQKKNQPTVQKSEKEEAKEEKKFNYNVEEKNCVES